MPNRQTVAVQRPPERAKARWEAFNWYSGDSPSPMEAAYHFAERAERDPANRSLYAEALEMFLATCWNIQRHQPQRTA